MGEKQAVQQRLALLGKYKYVLLMVLVGALLMLLPSFGAKKGQEDTASDDVAESGYSLVQTQKEMEEILAQMDGVGRVRVMLTVSSGSRRVYQSDREESYSGAADAPEDYAAQSETVLMQRGSGMQDALQTQEIYPAYVGALVVCDGAGNSGTVLKVKEAVSVLTGLGSDRISVVRRMQD